MKTIARILLLVIAWPCMAFAQGPGKPVIDIHLHAFSHLSQGPYPSYICSNPTDWPPWDPAEPYGPVFARVNEHPGCATPIASQPSDEALLENTLAALERNNVIGFATYGEQFNAMHVNQTFTGVAIGSGKPDKT